jgi:hypothetical protein
LRITLMILAQTTRSSWLHLISDTRELESDRLGGRYEHLGDTVLGLAVTSLMLEMYPGLRVGPSTVRFPTPAATTAARGCQLTAPNYLLQKIRALIVGNYTLAEMCVFINLGPMRC